MEMIRYQVTSRAEFGRLTTTDPATLTDLERCIKLYDRKHTLFYLDPPYFGTEKAYGKDLFSRDDFANLAGILSGLKGQFLMSINDTPEVRKIFAGFQIEEIETTWSMKTRAKGGGGKVGELIVSASKRISAE